ncbi:DUF484 family protein [Aliikangiella sp. G2MR2-5]|uniref:DUF484 family protein n=1 Tax=Aliikangiella sp. G2MR2-5 TaxID=2788943 RepID=UPI0018AA97A6|nr:DUF484 family protein [Aliikangiella sp. G2MR2-5]
MKLPPQVETQALEQGCLTQFNQLMEEAAVKNFLLENPDFLHKNPQLLTHLNLPHQVDNATSLVERQVKVLRDRNMELQTQLIDMLQAAISNEKLLLQCNQFMLALLDCGSLSSLTATIVRRLKEDFQLDGAALMLVGDYHDAHPAQVVASPGEIKALLNCQFPDSQPLCGRLEASSKKALFGDLSSNLQSFALIPLGKGCQFGVLALGSNDISRFEPQMGTLFVELIAKLISHIVRRFESA